MVWLTKPQIFISRSIFLVKKKHVSQASDLAAVGNICYLKEYTYVILSSLLSVFVFFCVTVKVLTKAVIVFSSVIHRT